MLDVAGIFRPVSVGEVSDELVHRPTFRASRLQFRCTEHASCGRPPQDSSSHSFATEGQSIHSEEHAHAALTNMYVGLVHIEKVSVK